MRRLRPLAASFVVPVLGGEISTEVVRAHFAEHGIVVIDTMRTVARRIAAEVCSMISATANSEEADLPLHMSFEAADRGWVDCLVDCKLFDAATSKRLAISAVEQWMSVGTPPTYDARVAQVTFGLEYWSERVRPSPPSTVSSEK